MFKALNRLAPRERLLVLVLLILVIMGAVYQLAGRNLWPRYREATQRLEQNNRQISQSLRQVKELPVLQQEVNQLEDRLEVLQQGLDRDLRGGLHLVDMGQSKGEMVRVLGVYPREMVNQGDYLALPLQLKMEGEYLPIVAFIDSLEHLSNVPRVQSLDLVAQDTGPYPIVTADLSLVLFSSINPRRGDLLGEWQLGRFDSFNPALGQLLSGQEAPPKIPGSNNQPNQTPVGKPQTSPATAPAGTGQPASTPNTFPLQQPAGEGNYYTFPVKEGGQG